MATLRTSQFYAATPPVVGGVNTWTTAYTVPAGKVIILKNTSMFNATTSTKIGGVRVLGAHVIRQVTLSASGTAPFTDSFSTWVVLTPTQAIQVLQQPGGLMSYILSGSLLFI